MGAGWGRTCLSKIVLVLKHALCLQCCDFDGSLRYRSIPVVTELPDAPIVELENVFASEKSIEGWDVKLHCVHIVGVLGLVGSEAEVDPCILIQLKDAGDKGLVHMALSVHILHLEWCCKGLEDAHLVIVVGLNVDPTVVARPLVPI